jgi:hypothetical protein
MLYLKDNKKKEKEKRKKIFYVEKARVKLTYSKRYKTLQNIVHRGRGLHYFSWPGGQCRWINCGESPQKLQTAAEKVRKFTAEQQICRVPLKTSGQAGRQVRERLSRSSLLQPALTSEKQKNLLIQFILIN